MRSETIKVKRPSWVRIVNPEPIQVLDRSYRYGDALMLVPGGVLRIVSDRAVRALAMYQAPHPPTDRHECPSDALVFATPNDLRLTAEGLIGHAEPYDLRMPEWTGQPAQGLVAVGDACVVPKTRLVRAFFRPIEKIDEARKVGGPFREEASVTHVRRRSEWAPIRAGAKMTVIGVDGAMLRVVYQAVPAPSADQLVSGAWFHVPEAEFLRMRDEARELQEHEALERAVVIGLLRSL